MALIKELRIDNILIYIGNLVKVKAIFPTHFICETADGITIGNSLQSRFDPILLRFEILQDCGFVKTGELRWEHKKDRGIVIVKSQSAYHLYKGSAGNIAEVKHLHTLQNGYFFLTEGKELEVKIQHKAFL